MSIDARVAGSGTPTEPDEVANGTLQSIELIKDIDTQMEQILMSVTRSGPGQCTGSNNRLNIDPNPVGGQNCGNQSFDSFVSTVANDSKNDKLTAVFRTNSSPSVELEIPKIRVVDPTSSEPTSFGTLNQASLQNLILFSRGGAANANIRLSPPAGAAFICISDGGNNEDICVYSDREVSIPESRLNRSTVYFVLTMDAENNSFQREYRLPPPTLANSAQVR